MLKQKARTIAIGILLTDLALTAISLPIAWGLRQGPLRTALPDFFPLAIYPLPTFNFNPAAGTGQLTEVDNQTLHENYFLARFDYNVTQKDSVFLRYFLDKQYLLDPFSGGERVRGRRDANR